jgi:hypothetical protein
MQITVSVRREGDKIVAVPSGDVRQSGKSPIAAGKFALSHGKPMARVIKSDKLIWRTRQERETDRVCGRHTRNLEGVHSNGAFNNGNGITARETATLHNRQTEAQKAPKPIHRLILDETKEDINGWLFDSASEAIGTCRWTKNSSRLTIEINYQTPSTSKSE